jgi:phosphate acetyltransferase
LTRSAYITAMEPQSGKSLVALGLMEMLSTRVERIGFFRPIVPGGSERDVEIELIRSRYQLDSSYDEMHALTVKEATGLIAAGAHDEIAKRVLAAYRHLERDREFVVCEGTDFGTATHALDFDLNADLANQLGCPVLAVVRGGSASETMAAIRLARESLERKGCELLGVIASRVPSEAVNAVSRQVATRAGDGPVYVLPEDPELAYPTVGEIAAALDAKLVFEAEEELHREVRAVRVAAMSVEHFVDDLIDGTLVIVPADRLDILVSCLACTLSPAFPAVSGIVLTAGYELHPSVRRMLEDAPFAVLEVPERTYLTATAVHAVRPVITTQDERKIATALGVFESGVDSTELAARIAVQRPTRMTPLMFEYELIERAKANPMHIVLPEGGDDRILRAADILLRRAVVRLTLLGNVEQITARAAALGLDLGSADLIDPLRSPLRGRYAQLYHDLRKHKGVTEEVALDTLGDVSYFGTMMVHVGEAAGMVSGAAHTTGDTVRPAFEFIRALPEVSVVSSVFFMCLADRVLVYGDCAVNPTPDNEQLADIAISSAETAATFGIEPRVAMLSYSTGESARGDHVDAVRSATEIVRKRRPDLKVEGPIQYDAAVDASVAKLKLPESEVAGQATVFIFPDLDTGNVAYKAVQRSANAVAVGPVLQGLRKPVNDLSRGCTVTDIVSTVAITAIQAQNAA